MFEWKRKTAAKQVAEKQSEPPKTPDTAEDPAVFECGVYSKAERAMLDDFRARAESLHGWAGEARGKEYFKVPLNLPEADGEMFRVIARNNDPKNLLYRSESYAAQSRWGRMIAPPMFLLDVAQYAYLLLEIPADVGRIVSCHTGAQYEWAEQVYDGDRLQVLCESPRLEDETPGGKQPYRVMAAYYTNRYYKQGGVYIGSITHCEKWIYAAPGTPADGALHIGYEKGAPLPKEPVAQTTNFVYTPEQARQIQDYYEAEKRRADHIRYWEDTGPGETLPGIVNGPITEWDAVAAVGPSAEKTLTMMEIRQRYPEKVVYDENGIPHHRDEVYLSKAVPVSQKMYSSTAPEQTLASHLLRAVSNWMGDDGFITGLIWRRMTNAAIGDTLLGCGRVSRKYCDDSGHGMVELEVWAENLRGFLCAAGIVTVRLPRRGGETSTGELVREKRQLYRGDRVRVLGRDDWPFEGGYPLTGKYGRVIESVADMPGCVYCLLDDADTGVDPRAVLAFSADSLAKC